MKEQLHFTLNRSSNSWKLVGNLNFPRYNHKVVTTTDGIFAVGGTYNGDEVTQVQCTLSPKNQNLRQI